MTHRFIGVLAAACFIVAIAGCGGGDDNGSNVSISVSPSPKTLGPGMTQAFTATVTGTTNTAVTWSVQEAGGGTVTNTGVYTAPATAGVFHVVATSVADSAAKADAEVTVTTTQVVVAVSPPTARVQAGGTQQFAATVANNANTNVTWSVTEGATGGTVSAAGLYTAPATAGTYHVRATSAADSTKSDTATVTVFTPIGVAITPDPASVKHGATLNFTATVTGTTNHNVTWSVVEAGGGTITNAGVYTAPATAGTYHVKATSAADTTVSDTVAVTVTPDITVAVTPKTVTLQPNGTQDFTATVTGTATTTVNWSVVEAGGGTVNASGHYTAPAANGTYHVKATSTVDNTAFDQATVTVAAPVSVAVSPKTATVAPGGTKTFTATVTGSAQGVNWTVSEAGGGTVDASGLYTAPQAAGTYHVVATSKQDATKSDSATITVPAAPTTISKFSAATYAPNTALTVTLTAVPASGTSVYAVEDAPPTGWVVSNISDNGAFDSTTGKVKWGPFFDNTTRNLTYTVTPPAGATGSQTFAGVGSFDGTNVDIVGDRTINTQ